MSKKKKNRKRKKNTHTPEKYVKKKKTKYL